MTFWTSVLEERGEIKELNRTLYESGLGDRNSYLSGLRLSVMEVLLNAVSFSVCMSSFLVDNYIKCWRHIESVAEQKFGPRDWTEVSP